MPSFGEHLKHIRESKGYSIEEFSALTKISSRFLQALENGQYTVLPGGIFNRGFIKSYARYCGVDEKQLLSEYGESVKPAWAPGSSFLPVTQAPETLEPGRVRNVVITVAVILVLAFGAFLYFRSGGDPESQKKISVENTSSAPMSATNATSTESRTPPPLLPPPGNPDLNATSNQSSNPETNAAKGLSSGTETNPASVVPGAPADMAANASGTNDTNAPSGSFSLQIVASELSWVSVKRDGKEAYRKNMLPQESIRLFAKEKFEIIFGNAGGVTLILDGKTLPPLGRRGEVKTLSLDRASGLRTH